LVAAAAATFTLSNKFQRTSRVLRLSVFNIPLVFIVVMLSRHFTSADKDQGGCK